MDNVTRLLMQGAAGAAGGGLYIDEVFSTYLYKGLGQNANTITNGIDLSSDGDGGMVWIKNRDENHEHIICDTVRGVNKSLIVNGNGGQASGAADSINYFNANGFGFGNSWSPATNKANNYASWTFRKAPGFFTIAQWTGNASAPRSISHDLGSVPGLIMVKCTSSGSTDWMVWHRDFDAKEYMTLNSTAVKYANEAKFGGQVSGSAKPTSTTFSLGTSNDVNGNGNTYIAYIFAGGASSAATARSVDVDSGDYLSIPDDTGWALGQTWTIEAWVNPDSLGSSYNTVVAQDGNWYFSVLANGTCQMNGGGGSHDSASGVIKANTWTHMAYVSNSGTGQWYINGIASGSTASKNITDTSGTLYIGNQTGSSWPWDGKISNLRIVKGTAVYTSSFRPPYEPLTNITNTVLLCCNNSSVTGSTVSPGTITNSSTTASTDSPFDDPDGFKFGEKGNQNLVKCGSYTGVAAAETINLGFEPQWVMVKCTNNSTAHSNWHIYDSMRGVVTGGNDKALSANIGATESDTYNYYSSNNDLIEFTPTGFTVDPQGLNFTVNGSQNKEYIYMAVRRPDPLVGKPAEVGTDAFAMDTGAGSSTIPNFDSGFPVDFAFARQVASSASWDTSARLIGTNFLRTEASSAQGTSANFTWDSNVGWNKHSNYNSGAQSWMWKRHAGFDVVTYTGSYAAADHPHNLGKIPEMYWIKKRNAAAPWRVYHKGVNGGSNPEAWYMELNTAAAQSQADSPWFAPTSTHLRLKSNGNVQWVNTFIAILFASVDGISKVGYYDGSSSDVTVTTGFQPRFIIIKAANAATEWTVWDTTRGLTGSGNDARLKINSSDAQYSAANYITGLSSTGFTVGQPSASDLVNKENFKYIYYAHA